MQCQPTILTLHDAVTDSPVYRVNASHFDDQIDLLEKWLDQLSKYLKLYNEKLHKFNLETNNVCKKTIPQGIDSTLIDPNFTGAVIRSFSDALQTNLAFKTKLVSDLEDSFIQPLQQFVKTHLKDFKEFRKQHEKALERYESQLYKYTSQSKAKEASAVREEAFRLHEARKAYVRMSGQHVIRILQFRSVLEHCLVDCFSSAILAHSHDFEGGKQVWAKLDLSLASWKQWLVDDRSTCDYQLHRLQAARKQLESEYLQQTQPLRDLEKYAISTVNLSAGGSFHSLDVSFSSNRKEAGNIKWGYLYTRVSRLSWARKWFFLYSGYFGTCSVSSKLKGAITVGEKISVLLCDIKSVADVDRRFCFEVVSVQQPSLVLQAETEGEKNDWIAAFAKAKHLLLNNEKLPLHTVAPTTTHPPAYDSAITIATTTTSFPLTDSNGGDSDSVPRPTTTHEEKSHHSAVMLSTSADNQDQVVLATSTSLTPLLISEAVKVQLPVNSTSAASNSSPSLPNSSTAASAAQTLTTAMSSTASLNPGSPSATITANTAGHTAGVPTNSNSGSWGIPWALVPNMFSGSNQEEEVPQSPMSPTMPSTPGLFSSSTDGDGHPIVWPIRRDNVNLPKADLSGYSADLEAKNKELRRLFGGVDSSEIVLDAFIGSLKKKPVEDTADGSNTSPTQALVAGSPTVDTFDQELNTQLEGSLKSPVSQFGYSYTGRAFITQETFWYYSCILMNCVNTVAVQLSDIKNVRLVRDQSIKDAVTKNGPAKNVALALDLHSQPDPIVITTLLNDVEVVMERLRFAVENSKTTPRLPVQVLFDVIQNMSASINKSNMTHKVVPSNSEKTSALVTASSKALNKAHSDTDLRRAEIYQPEPVMSPVPENKKIKQRKGRKSSAADKQNAVPRTGALAAAMMAATMAGGTGLFDPSKMVDAGATQKRHYGVEENVSATTPPPLPIPTASVSPAVAKVSAEAEEEIPANIQVPKGPAGCGCDEHLDKIEDEVELPVSAKKLYEYLFGEDRTIWDLKNSAALGTNLRMDPWVNIEGKLQRTLKYILPVSNPMVKIKEAEVVETQVVLKKEEYVRYVVQISTKTAQLPYADAFVPSVRYCISWESKTSCKLTCSLGVKFVKSVLVKSMINKAAIKGMGESIQQFIPILVRETNEMAGKKSSSAATGLGLQEAKADQGQASSAAIAATAGKTPAQSGKGSLEAELWGYLNTAVEFVNELPMSIKAGVASVMMLWILWSLLFSSSSSSSSSKQAPSLGIPSYSMSDRASSRAVYLRDLEDGLLKTELQPKYAHDESYRLFLTNGTSHPWYNPNHHRMAVEYVFSRERVAMLRHDMLVIFHLLNQVDAQLLENEYINWMLDTQLQCRISSKGGKVAPEQQEQTCDTIQGRLESFFA